ncbi:MAG: AAA family ATPase, partial [Anaerolineae bacterium]|nr:AAA family ATPase [Anaerolineae bacterium]
MAFLATRFHQPVPRPNQVARPRLIERLQAGLEQSHRLTLVSAPAGFGKTTLVSAWLNRSDHPVVWLSLDEADNDPIHFLSYLIAAFQNAQPDLGRMAQTLLQSPQMPPLNHLMTLLLNDLAVGDSPLVLVLDDYQVISAPPVHDLLTFFVEHQPPTVHLVLTTREDPPLPLPRLRARGQVTDIRERDLRFTPDEAAAFLNQTINLSLDPAVIAALEARTEGWVAGLQLASLAVQENPDQAGAFVSAFTGDDRYVMAYLMAELLERHPDAIRAFLRETALLDRLTASLCDALTGRGDSQFMLEQLDASNLFVIPLDHRREWYRYHRLFAEFLRATLTPDERPRLHQRAAQWYEAQNLLEPAVQQTLASARLTGDYAALARLVTVAAEQTLSSTN